MKKPPPPIQPINWPRADPEALAAFDPTTKQCTMNCGPSSQDPRTAKERQFLCDECVPAIPPRKDHEVREIINQVRDVAEKFAGTQQLRARIADILIPVLKGKA